MNEQSLERLIDRINKLTMALENVDMGSNRRDSAMYPFYRHGNDGGVKRFGDLDDFEKKQFGKWRAKQVAALKDEINRRQDALNKREEEERKTRSLIEQERKQIEDRLKDSKTLLSERKNLADREKELAEEIERMKKSLAEETEKIDELGKQMDGLNGELKTAWKNAHANNMKSNRASRAQMRSDISRGIYESGLGDTRIGRFAQTMIGRQQRVDNLSLLSRYMRISGSKKAATAMFGDGKMMQVATKGINTFAKGLGLATKALSGVVGVLGVIMMVAEIVKDVAVAMKKRDADVIRFKIQDEELQYQRSKQMATLLNQSALEEIKYVGETQMKMLEVQSQNMMESLNIFTERYVKDMGISLGMFTQGITASAYQAAEASVDTAAAIEKANRHAEQRGIHYERFMTQRGLTYEAAQANIAAEQQVAETAYAAGLVRNEIERSKALSKFWVQNTWRDRDIPTEEILGEGGTMPYTVGEKQQKVNAVNPITGKPYKEYERLNGYSVGTDITKAVLYAGGAGDLVEAELEKITQRAEYGLRKQEQYVEAEAMLIKQQNERDITALDQQNQILNKQLDATVQAADKVTDVAANIEKGWIKLAQANEQFLQKMDTATNKLGIGMGITRPAELHRFQKDMMRSVLEVGYKFGKTAEDLANLQNVYIEATGRNKFMGREDYGNLLGLGKYLGDDNLAAQYASEMEIFNHGVSESVDMIDTVIQQVNKVGLNGRKYTKDVVNNLKLAQKYNFKEGTRGIMEMARWAQQTRFNMGSLSSILEKVQGGGIEDVIKMSAGFQVLGGRAAMHSDPLGMMYDAWADPQAYAKRLQDMTKGFGRFDTGTGETRFNINESMMIAQLAKLQGRSTEDLRQEIMQRNRAEQINKVLGEYGGYTDEQRDMLANRAYYKNGQWVVQMQGGGEKDIQSLSPKDFEKLMPKEHNERMETYMAKVVSVVEEMSGAEIFSKTGLGLGTMDNFWEEAKNRVNSAMQYFIDDYPRIMKNVVDGMKAASDQYKGAMDRFSQGDKTIDSEVEKLRGTISNLDVAINGMVGMFDSAMKEIRFATGITSKTAYQNAQENINNNNIDNIVNLKKSAKAFVQGDESKEVIHSLVTQAKNREGMREKDIEKLYNIYVNEYKGSRIMGIGSEFGWDYSPNDPDKILEKGVKYLHKGSWGASYDKYNKERGKKTNDAFMPSNGTSTLVAAAKVHPINDGVTEIAQTAPNDSALFAKPGGPFDKLFNGVFKRVDDMYGVMSDDTMLPMSDPYDEPYSSSMYEQPSSMSKLTVDDMNVNLNGKIELVGQGGQSVDIMGELRRNPLFVRQITEMIVSQLNNNANGGRNDLFHNRYSRT